jgi:hypothetical protein
MGVGYILDTITVFFASSCSLRYDITKDDEVPLRHYLLLIRVVAQYLTTFNPHDRQNSKV